MKWYHWALFGAIVGGIGGGLWAAREIHARDVAWAALHAADSVRAVEDSVMRDNMIVATNQIIGENDALAGEAALAQASAAAARGSAALARQTTDSLRRVYNSVTMTQAQQIDNLSKTVANQDTTIAQQDAEIGAHRTTISLLWRRDSNWTRVKALDDSVVANLTRDRDRWRAEADSFRVKPTPAGSTKKLFGFVPLPHPKLTFGGTTGATLCGGCGGKGLTTGYGATLGVGVALVFGH